MILQSIIFSGAILSIFLILLLQSKPQKSNADRWLVYYLGVNACLLLFYYDNLTPNVLLPQKIQFLGFLLPLLSAPLLYFYIRALTFGAIRHIRFMMLHFLPFGLIYLLFICYENDIFIAYTFPHFKESTPSWVILFITMPMAMVAGIYSIGGLRVLVKYQEALPNAYSFTEKIMLNWLKWIVLSNLLLFVVLFLLIKFGVNIGLLTYQNLFGVVGSILTSYVFLVGFLGLKQTTIFANVDYHTGINKIQSSSSSYQKSGLSDNDVALIFEKLETHLQQQKPYLDEHLNLFMLAQQLNVTSNQLSQVINQKTSSHFFNYINRYRVEAVKEKLKDPRFRHYSILAIGFECGFGSKSAFNKIFKETEGMTPSEYQKNEQM